MQFYFCYVFQIGLEITGFVIMSFIEDLSGEFKRTFFSRWGHYMYLFNIPKTVLKTQ